jgi:hypothetical protein
MHINLNDLCKDNNILTVHLCIELSPSTGGTGAKCFRSSEGNIYTIDPGAALWLCFAVKKQLLGFSNLLLEFLFDFPIAYPSHWFPRHTTIPKAGPELIPKLSGFYR